MGLKGAHSFTYTLKNLTVAQIFFIATDRLKRNQGNRTTTRQSPRIDIDISWVVRTFGKGNEDSRIYCLLNIAKALTEVGFLVNLVCDGVERHHSKRATISRQAEA
jgi:hypothetical protein